MSTLSKRATPSQQRIMRAVEGAVRNVAHYHPDWQFRPEFARSIAKRATGTISASWPELLAAPMRSDSADAGRRESALPSASRPATVPKRGASQALRRPPLKLAHNRLGAMAGWARKAGHEARAAALADALRVLASAQAECAR